jgi:hypothetical protein
VKQRSDLKEFMDMKDANELPIPVNKSPGLPEFSSYYVGMECSLGSVDEQLLCAFDER